tara:strand:- start:94 stop:537 length:444 start_codon:yes stop_codon:yes gene_type:complete
MKIGIVGYSSKKIDENMGTQLLEQEISKIVISHSKAESVEIVTGLTSIGIPKLAYQIADKRNYIKTGISAQQAYLVKCGVYPVDNEIIVGEVFGDESQTFVDYIDYLVRIGGGKQSAHEVALFKEKCVQLEWNLSERLFEQEFQLSI